MPATSLRSYSHPLRTHASRRLPRWTLSTALLLSVLAYSGLQALGTARHDGAAQTRAAPSTSAVSSVVVSNAGQPAAASVADAVPVDQGAAVSAAPLTVQPDAAPALAPVLSPVERWRAQGILIETDGQSWDATSLANVDQALATLPPRIRALLGNRDLGPMHIVVNREGRTQSGNQPYGRPANFFSTNDGRNELVLFPDQSASTTLHELGHAYNLRRIPAGRYALVLLDDEMRSFMAATGWQVLSTPDQVQAARDHTQVQTSYTGAHIWTNVSNDDPLEDFANSFALYFLNPDGLRQLSPERFDWFQANVGR